MKHSAFKESLIVFYFNFSKKNFEYTFFLCILFPQLCFFFHPFLLLFRFHLLYTVPEIDFKMLLTLSNGLLNLNRFWENIIAFYGKHQDFSKGNTA